MTTKKSIPALKLQLLLKFAAYPLENDHYRFLGRSFAISLAPDAIRAQPFLCQQRVLQDTDSEASCELGIHVHFDGFFLKLDK